MIDQPGLGGRHRNRDGEISRKHGNTRVATLRLVYGRHFAPGFAADAELADVLEALDKSSLSQLVHDHDFGHLGGKIARAVDTAGH
ncbi:hypothetical protein [Sphingomonas sp. CFBP 8760]|uniref:hypothetical protein n=1 Tax=Sphingomonas sp. CFBP 8760 TaxID=2775282 RepID=UPI0018FE0D81|nr:hypothetical protein [Sphingomonas sp. CFBP 8760]